MKRTTLAAALAAFFVLPAEAQTTQFKVMPEKVCKGVEQNLSLYLGGRFGEFETETAEGNHDGLEVMWVLWRNEFSGTWTLSTNDTEQECIVAFGVGHQSEDIFFFIERALTETKGMAL